MGKLSYVTVYRKNGEEINSMLKRFKRKVEKSGHLNELKERKYYLKPSVVKRKQKQNAQYTERQNMLKERLQ